MGSNPVGNSDFLRVYVLFKNISLKIIHPLTATVVKPCHGTKNYGVKCYTTNYCSNLSERLILY